jgi:dihydrofolate synthase / folylpolyglutamate synthase
MAVGAPLLVHGQDWTVWEEHGRMVFQDAPGLLDLPQPALIGAHQVENAGRGAGGAARARGSTRRPAPAAVTEAEWPARMQRLRTGPLVEAARGAELWLDGGHNPAAGTALAEALGRLPARPVHLVVGMLRTKDVGGFLRPLARVAQSVTRGRASPASRDAACRRDGGGGARGIAAETAPSVGEAVAAIVAADPQARILICGSLYLAGRVLRENG